MLNFKKRIRAFSRSPIGLFIRQHLNILPPAIKLRYSEVASDLFIWRDPAQWETYFNLSHLGPILNPNYKENYEGLIEFYGSNGDVLGSTKITLIYGESKLYDICKLAGDLIINTGANGTFAIFHLADLDAIFDGEKVCIAERGFVSYKRKQDISALRSYSHGNANAVAYSCINRKSRCLGVVQKSKQYYRAQLRLDDSISCEIGLVNFLEAASKVGVYQWNNNVRYKVLDLDIPSRGFVFLSSEHDFNPHLILEFESRLNFLRPVIFKHYKNHFDVLHG